MPLHLPHPRPSAARRRRRSAPDAAGPVLRALAPSVYWPTAVFAVGTGAAGPVLVLAATDVGLSHAVAAGTVGLMGLVGVVSAPVAGAVVARTGGRRAMALGTALAVVASLAIVVAIGHHHAASQAAFVGSVIALALASNLWALARQGYVAQAVPGWARARSLSFLGGMMRLGVLVGPAVGSGALLLAGRRGPFLLQMAMALAALSMVLRWTAPPADVLARAGGQAAVRGATHDSQAMAVRGATHASQAAGPVREHVDLAATAVVAVAMTCLQLLRTNRQVLVPLWGAHLGMSDALISATFAAGAALDVAMFLPSGRWMDRYGRLAGIVPALTVMGASIAVIVVWTSPVGFVVGTCLMGLGNGFGSGIVMTMGADLAPVPGRERFLGWWQGIGNIGSAAGPFVVSALTASVGLAAGMWVTAALGVLGGAWAALALPRAYAHAGMDTRGRPLRRGDRTDDDHQDTPASRRRHARGLG